MQAASSAPDLPRLSRRQSYGPTSSSLYLDSLPPFSAQKSLAKGQRSVPAIEHLSHPGFPSSGEEPTTPGGSLIVGGKVVDVGGLGVEPWDIWSGEVPKRDEKEEEGTDAWENQRKAQGARWSPDAFTGRNKRNGDERVRTVSEEANNVGALASISEVMSLTSPKKEYFPSGLPRSTSFSSSLDVRGATSVDGNGEPPRQPEGGNDSDHLVRRRSMANLGVAVPSPVDGSARSDTNSRVRFANPPPSTQSPHPQAPLDPSTAPPARNPGEGSPRQSRTPNIASNGRQPYAAYGSSPEGDLSLAMRNMKVSGNPLPPPQPQPRGYAPMAEYPYYYPQAGYPVEYGTSPAPDPAAFNMYRRESNPYISPGSPVPYSAAPAPSTTGGRVSPTTLRRTQSTWGVGTEYGAAPTPAIRPASYSYQPQPQPNQTGGVLIPAYAPSPYAGPMELASPEMSPALFRASVPAAAQQQPMLVARRSPWAAATPIPGPPPGYRSASMDFSVPAWPFAQPGYATSQGGLRYDDRVRAVRSPLLDEFRTNRHRRWELQVRFFLHACPRPLPF
jgi:hypothetical protein